VTLPQTKLILDLPYSAIAIAWRIVISGSNGMATMLAIVLSWVESFKASRPGIREGESPLSEITSS
jgi:hypothetical protein